jgi:hypothetical protein
MRRLTTWAAAAVVPALMVSLLTIGCGGTATEAPKTSDTGKKVGKEGKSKKKALETVASTGTGTLKGRVTLDGGEPDLPTLTKELQEKMAANAQDGKFCLSAPEDQKSQQKWVFGQNKGVGNVFVWLQPPAGHYFKVDMAKKTWPDVVKMNQPHCAFMPHANVLFPSAYNADKPSDPTPTGQKFIVTNTAPMNHNTAWKGGSENQGDNKIIPSGKDLEVELRPDSEAVMFHCDIHKWMDAVVRVFDHPYAAVTDKDGNYEIKNVPAGAELSIIVWHEVAGYGNKGKDGDKVTLKAGDNSHDYTVKAK